MTTGPAAAPGDVEARLAEVLREHGRFGSRYCGCGARVVEGEHRAHVAVVLASIVADEVARAVVPLRRYFEAHAVTARATGRDDRDWLDALALLDQAEAKP